MEEFLAKIKSKPHLVLSVPTILCFLQFIMDLVAALSDWRIDNEEMHQLLSSADGFETVVLLILMVILKDKKK